MKKQLCMVLATTVITTLSLPAVAFADTTASTSNNTSTSAITAPAVIVKDMTFTSPTVSLSLNDTYKKLETSTAMELLNISKKMDEAAAKGNIEKLSDANAAVREKVWSYNSSDNKMVVAAQKFAEKMVVPNHTARVNKLHRDIYEQYYKLKNTEMKVAIAKESLDISKKLLSNSQLKLKLGTVSKMDVMNAEMDVKTAEDKYKSAQDGLNALKMNFNLQMGFSLMQQVQLTDSIKEAPLPTTTLSESITSALAKRIEIQEAAYDLEMSGIQLAKYQDYPKSSASYLSAQSALLSSKKANDLITLKIEMEIRTKYMDMMTSYQKVQSGKQSVANAKEASRLAQLQYDAGMSTLDKVQSANLASNNAQNEQADALLDYYLAIEDFRLAQDVGVTPATIK